MDEDNETEPYLNPSNTTWALILSTLIPLMIMTILLLILILLAQKVMINQDDISREITVDYLLTGTATGSGIDFDLEPGTLIIGPGENTSIITIPNIIDDDLAEADETIIITLSNPTNAALGDDNIYTHTILANDDDKRPILISTSPQDDSTRVPIDSDIILTFNKDVNCESGTINIESEDNSSSFAVSLPNQIVVVVGRRSSRLIYLLILV